MKGYVYIISNKAMPGIFKIGFTLKDPALRAKELDSTGVPYPFIVEYEILVDEPHALEQRVHKSLRAQREGKEWFRCSFTQAVQTIRACYQEEIYREKCFKTEREKELERVRQEQILRELEQKRKEEERVRIQKERQKQVEEKIRIQGREKLRKKAVERHQKKFEKFIFNKSLTIFIYLESISLLITLFLVIYHDELNDSGLKILFILSLPSIFISDKIKDLSLNRWTEEYKNIGFEEVIKLYHSKDKNTTIVTCPHCGRQIEIPKTLYRKVHCASCLSFFSVMMNHDGTYKYNISLQRNTQHIQRTSIDTGIVNNYRYTHQKDETGNKVCSYQAIGKQRNIDLERAWNEELIRRGWNTQQPSFPFIEKSTHSQQPISYHQTTSFKVQGTKRDLELERAWREEEERRRREREARKLQQEGKVIIRCIECGQKLRVSNVPYLHVRCPKCSCRFYWENK